MMKNFLLSVFFLAPILGDAQTDSIKIPMKNKLIFYEKSYTPDHSLKKSELYSRALSWFKTSFPNSKKPVESKSTGTISGDGLFKVIVSDSGNYYWLKPTVVITVTDNQYTFQAYSYYEKPVEKGITNDWSKIEYRWWDFRNGKPWSSEDKRLFEGLNQNTLQLMASLEKVLNK